MSAPGTKTITVSDKAHAKLVALAAGGTPRCGLGVLVEFLIDRAYAARKKRKVRR